MKSDTIEYVSYEELYNAYLDCRKRKRRTANALAFEIDDTVKLNYLWKELNKSKYEIGRSIVFCVDKPVKREVFAADFRDRIIHHLLINRLMGYFEKEFIDDSYSCREGKGTDYGIRQCDKYIIEATNNYTVEKVIVKCDLKSFFMTIDKIALFNKLADFIRNTYGKEHSETDTEYTIELARLIVFNEPQNNCIRKQPMSAWDGLPKEKSLFHCDKYKGLPIGNLTSQIFANFFLSGFDHYVKEILGCKYYGRYVDDFFIIVDDTAEAKKIIDKCREYLSSLGVTLHPKKFYIQPTSKGVKFIGAVIKPKRKYISNRTKGNFYDMLKKQYNYISNLEEKGLEPSLDDIEYFVGSVNSYLGFMKHYNTYKLRRKMLFSKLVRKWLEYCYIDWNLNKLVIFREFTKNPLTSKHLDKSWYYGNGMHETLDFVHLIRPFE